MTTEVSTSGSVGKQKVLDEDEWTECLEAIIQRDFYPHIPKLQNKLEWIEAVRSRDPELLRQAQLNIAQRRAGIPTPIGATPAHFATPGLSSFRAPASMLRTPGGLQTPGPGAAGRHPEQQLSATEPSMAARAVEGMSLDGFMAKHTSEDNASFAEIMAESNKRRRLNKPWLFEQQEKGQLLLEDIKDRPLDGYGTSGQPDGRLLEWPYTSKNGLYYGRDSVALTDAEKSQQVQGPPKAINRTGTRFTPAAAPGAATPSSTDDSPSIASLGGSEAPGPDYSILATPSFTPGVEESPFITWGDLQGTPLRLDPDDDVEVDPAAASGPQFSIRERSGKDALAQKLGRSAAAKLRDRTATMRRKPLLPTPRAMPPPGTTPLRRGRPSTVTTPARPQLSQAGMKLAKSLRGKASSDTQLRASYSGTPSKRPVGGTPLLTGMRQAAPDRTSLRKVPPPKFSADNAAAAAAAAGQAAHEKQEAAAKEQQPAQAAPGSSGASMTDDLLNILRDEAVQKHVGAIRDKAVQHHVEAIREKALKKLACDNH